MAIAHFTDGESLSWRGDMTGPGKPQFTVPRQEVVACDLFSLMPGDLFKKGGLQRSRGGTKGIWNPQKPSGRRMT